jgi:hypothetical protein
VTQNPTTTHRPGVHPELFPLLTERLETLRRDQPGRPLPLYRMLLIKQLWEEGRLNPTQARQTVDAFYDENGLAIQASFARGVLAVVVGLIVLLVPMALLYWLLRLMLGR